MSGLSVHRCPCGGTVLLASEQVHYTSWGPTQIVHQVLTPILHLDSQESAERLDPLRKAWAHVEARRQP